VLSLIENGSSLVVVRYVARSGTRRSSRCPVYGHTVAFGQSVSRRPPGSFRLAGQGGERYDAGAGQKASDRLVTVIMSVFALPGAAGSGRRSGNLRCRGTPRQRSPAGPWPGSHPAPAAAPAAAHGRRPPRRCEPAPTAEPAPMSHTPCRFPHHIPAPSAHTPITSVDRHAVQGGFLTFQERTAVNRSPRPFSSPAQSCWVAGTTARSAQKIRGAAGALLTV
jgi:hypothetical protein